MDDKEWGEWITSHEMYFYKVAWSYYRAKGVIDDFHLVQEAVAEAMYQIWISRSRYVGDWPGARPWSVAIVKHCCAKVLRQTQAPQATVAPRAPDPEHTAIVRDTLRYQWDALAVNHKKIIWLRFCGYDDYEISDIMGQTWAQTRAMLSNARRRSKSVRD